MILNVPAKVLQVVINSESGTELFPYANGSGDIWWSGGSNPKFYRWEINLSITIQQHGSHLTREPFEYNGLDVFVGDYITRLSTGKVNKIVSVLSKTETSATIIVEDVFRYNTFRSNVGAGSLGLGNALIINTNEQGVPIVDPTPQSGVSGTFLSNLTSRFQNYNEQNVFELEQTGHSFVENDLIALDTNGDFVKANSGTFDKLVGSVIDPGPGPDKFLIKPFNDIHEHIQPALPGSKGSTIYIDGTTGEYTTSISPKQVYLQLTDAIPTVVRGTVSNPTTTAGNELNINGTVITFNGTSLSSAVTDIDAQTSATGVDATAQLQPAEASSQDGGLSLAYGVIASANSTTTPQAEINGTTVTFSTTTDGSSRFGSGFASGIDFATDINAAGIPNIEAVAEADNSSLTIKETNGGSITIVNVTNDSNGTPWAGASSSTAIPLSTSSSSVEILVLERADGGEIILTNVTGDPKGDFGIESAENGRLPVGLVLEQGIRRGDVYVVSDTSARNALTPLVGDMAYVLNAGQNEWAMYIWDGSAWVQLTDQDASDVDAKTESVSVNNNSSSPVVVARVSDGARITHVSVEVTEAWTQSPTLTVGDLNVNDRFMPAEFNDLTTLGTYASTPAFQYDTGGLETEILVYLNSDGSPTGAATITISYL